MSIGLPLRFLLVELLEVVVSQDLDLLERDFVLLFHPLLLDLGLVYGVVFGFGFEPVSVYGCLLELLRVVCWALIFLLVLQSAARTWILLFNWYILLYDLSCAPVKI